MHLRVHCISDIGLIRVTQVRARVRKKGKEKKREKEKKRGKKKPREIPISQCRLATGRD